MALQVIDTGTPGDPSTGDPLFEGGQKINSMFEEIYGAGAPTGSDFRMTGFWIPDETSGANLLLPIPAGLKIDVDTSVAQKTVLLGDGETYAEGDEIWLRDRRNSWHTNPVVLEIVGPTGSIDGSSQKTFRSRGGIIKLTCLNGPGNQWESKVESRSGRFDQLTNFDASITSSTSFSGVLYNTNNLAAMKVLVSITDNSDPGNKTVSELLVSDDGTNAISTEYALLNTKGNTVGAIDFNFVSNEVVITVSTTLASASVRVKTMEFIEK